MTLTEELCAVAVAVILLSICYAGVGTGKEGLRTRSVKLSGIYERAFSELQGDSVCPGGVR